MSKAEKSRPARPRAARRAPGGDDKPAAGGGQRIAKAMARAGLCSRREAETWIADGRVTVNGEVCATPAVNVEPRDVVLVDGAPLPLPDKTRLFLFHKPRGLVTSDRDPEGRTTVMDFLREHWPAGPRVVTIGRLDINTEGLLLLTNDGGLARVLELPETGWIRRYRVRAKGATDQAKIDTLAGGISIEGVHYAGIEATLDRVQGANCWLTMGLREGKNREIKRVLEHLGLEVNRLIRLSFGPFQLLDLAEGAVEEVPTRVLRDQLGDTLAAKAGAVFESPAATSDPAGAEPRQAARRDRSSQAPAPRSGRRHTERRKPEEVDERRPRPDRPAPGKRKHISAIRAARAERGVGPARPRIDRSQTVDRRDRVVAVERIAGEGASDGTRARRGERPKRPTEAPRRNAGPKLSPSAAGKRERIARSGESGAKTRNARAGARDCRSETGARKTRDVSGPSKAAARPASNRGPKKPPARTQNPSRATKRQHDRRTRRPDPKR